MNGTRKEINRMIAKYSTEKTIEMIKMSQSSMFSMRQHHPRGVTVYVQTPTDDDWEITVGSIKL